MQKNYKSYQKFNERSNSNSKRMHEETMSPGKNALMKQAPVVSHSQETDLYFKHALETLKSGIPDEEREIFVHNVLEQTEGQELHLSCQNTTSQCLEILLNEIDDLSIVIRFMKAFEADLEVACGNCFASHITEDLVYYGLKNMLTWSTDIEAGENDEQLAEKSQNVIFIISWIYKLGEFCLKNLQTCLEDAYGSHVLKSVIQALGGHFTAESVNQGKKAKLQKKFIETEYLGSDHSKSKETIALDAIPKFFVKMLKKLTKAFLKLDDMKVYAIEPGAASVIEALLFILKKRLPKRCKKFITVLSSSLFDSLTSEGLPDALVHKNCSYVVEKIFDSAAEDQLNNLWKIYIEPHLESLIKHSVGNFVVQRIFHVVKCRDEFESMCESLFPFFNLILECHHFGVWVSMASACDRLKAKQAQFMQNLMQCLHCLEPEDHQLHLVLLLLNFEKYEDFILRKNSSSKSDIRITLQGSLLIQAVLKFQKPVKVVKSFLNMKPEELSFLASHVQGCHVLTCFLQCVNVGEKNKDKFLQLLKPVLPTLACDQNGSLTLSRMWVLLTLKQKSVIAEELLKSDHILQKSRQGFGISKKFGLFYYKSKRDQWRTFQQNLTKKREHSDV